MRTRVVIQSRLSSSRLPGKALMTVAGYPLVELVARRASRSGFEVVVATSVEKYDDLIANHLARVGIDVVRGPLDDVLARFVDATSDLAPEDRVVRLTGDNPVADADLVQELIDAMQAEGKVYGRVDIEQVPEGLGAEVFTVGILREAAANAVDAYDHEHVTPWIRRNCGGELLFAPKDNPGDPDAYRCTTDCLHDYDRIARLFDEVTDPIAEPWSQIVARLKELVDGLGRRSQPLPNGRGISEVVVGSARIGVGESGRDMSVLRETFVDALDRGISHVYCPAADVAVVRAATLPALNKRLKHIVELNPNDGDLAVLVERAFADLGERKLAGVVIPASASQAAWQVLATHQRAGEIGEVGALLNSDTDPSTLAPEVTLVVVPEGGEVAGLAERGLIVLSFAGHTNAARIIEPTDSAAVIAAL